MGGSSVLNTLPTEHFTSDTVVTKCVQAFPTLSNSAQPAGWLVHACVLNHFSRVQLCVAPWTLWPTRLLCPWILQARVLEWVAVPSSRGSSQLKDPMRVSRLPALAGRFFTISATWEAHMAYSIQFSFHSPWR